MKCPRCGKEEIEVNTPKTVYGCGSSDYDKRPGTFIQSDDCKEYVNGIKCYGCGDCKKSKNITHKNLPKGDSTIKKPN